MTHPSFTTIATRTAARDPASLSQVGIVKYYYSQVAWKYSADVDPDGEGEARSFAEIAPFVYKFLHGEMVVGYGPSARQSIETAFQGAGLKCPEAQWLDCKKVTQRIWPERCIDDYALSAVAHKIKHPYQPGGTIEDAKAIGAVLIEAIVESGFSAEAWVKMAEWIG